MEQFICKFEDVATIAEWPASVRLLQLWAYLTGRARSFSLGPDEAYIMQALQTGFGLMAEEATDRLPTACNEKEPEDALGGPH